MKKPGDEMVMGFLDDLAVVDNEKYHILVELREILYTTFPTTDEKMMYGGIMFSLDSEFYSGLFVRKNHVSFEFSNGFKMTDPTKSLEGNGKFRRHLKIRSRDDILNKNVSFFVEQAL